MITLGIDCGTQSLKTLALDETGVIASASRNYDLLPDLPAGSAEQNPSDWIAALEATVEEVLSQLGSRSSEIQAIGVSGQQHGFVPLDATGAVIRPAKLWCDTSTQEECEIMRGIFGGATPLIERVGLDMLPGYTAPKILWLKRHEPENFAKLATVLLPHDYINFYLTGEKTMEYGDASGTALLDVRTRQWQLEICNAIDPSLIEKLPALQSSRKPAGELSSVLKKKWNLGNVIVSAGGGDNMMAAIGTGNVVSGRVTASLGTSGTIFAYSAVPTIDPAGEVAGFCDSTDAWMPLVCTMNVTFATEAARQLFGMDVKTFDAAAASVSAGADGLTFLPYLQGERTPNLPHASGVFHGVTAKNMTPAHFARATMEGVTLGLAYGLKRMRSLGIAPSEIRLTGGGSNSPVWRQLCADVFSCPVAALSSGEGAALGAALQAAAALGISMTELTEKFAGIDSTKTATPAPGGYDYDAALTAHTALTKRLFA